MGKDDLGYTFFELWECSLNKVSHSTSILCFLTSINWKCVYWNKFFLCVCGNINQVTMWPSAFWDATRAFMLLAVLSCFAGVVLGLSAFTNGTKNKRVRMGGIALVLSGDTENIFFHELFCTSAFPFHTFQLLYLNAISGTVDLLMPPSGFLALLALSIYTGVTVTFFGKRFLDWRFSWSYIIGWVAIILAFAAGISDCSHYLLYIWWWNSASNVDDWNRAWYTHCPYIVIQ